MYSQEIHWGIQCGRGGQKATSGVGIFFVNFCIEMVHFGEKVTNAVHHHWFSGGESEKTDLRLINFSSYFRGVEPVKLPPNYYHDETGTGNSRLK